MEGGRKEEVCPLRNDAIFASSSPTPLDWVSSTAYYPLDPLAGRSSLCDAYTLVEDSVLPPLQQESKEEILPSQQQNVNVRLLRGETLKDNPTPKTEEKNAWLKVGHTHLWLPSNSLLFRFPLDRSSPDPSLTADLAEKDSEAYLQRKERARHKRMCGAYTKSDRNGGKCMCRAHTKSACKGSKCKFHRKWRKLTEERKRCLLEEYVISAGGPCSSLPYSPAQRANVLNHVRLGTPLLRLDRPLVNAVGESPGTELTLTQADWDAIHKRMRRKKIKRWPRRLI